MADSFLNVVLFFCGSCCGSFLSCIAQRSVAHEDWIRGRSHCEKCGHVLSAIDLIPTLSYLTLHGKCRYCGQKLSYRYLLSELFSGFLFVLTYHTHLHTGFLYRDLILFLCLFYISLIDFDSYLIPDIPIIIGIINWMVGAYSAIDRKTYLIAGAEGAFLISGMIFALSLLMKKFTKKDCLGGGDIRLLFMTCLYTGVYYGFFLLFFSSLFGLFYIMIRKENRIPFGPCIALACIFILNLF